MNSMTYKLNFVVTFKANLLEQYARFDKIEGKEKLRKYSMKSVRPN